MTRAQRIAITTAVWAGCIAPTAALNIWPHVAALWDGTSGDILPHLVNGTVKAAFVVGLAYLPLAAEGAANRKHSFACWLVWCVLATVCFFNAMEGAGRLRDQIAAPLRDHQAGVANLKSRIGELERSRNEVPRHTPATPAMVASARGTVDVAAKSRQDECAKRGPFCRQREDAETTRRAELAEIEGRAVLTDKLAGIDTAIAKARAELASKGAAPTHSDPAAARLALLIGSTEEKVADWWPSWLAFVIEIWAALGAYCFLPRTEVLTARKDLSIVLPVKKAEKKPAGPRKAAVSQSPATPAKSRKSLETKGDGATTVREWFEGAVFARDGAELRVKDVRDHYAAWCESRGIEPANLTVFGTTMKRGLGVAYIERSKRGFYTGIGLHAGKQGLKVVK